MSTSYQLYPMKRNASLPANFVDGVMVYNTEDKTARVTVTEGGQVKAKDLLLADGSNFKYDNFKVLQKESAIKRTDFQSGSSLIVSKVKGAESYIRTNLVIYCKYTAVRSANAKVTVSMGNYGPDREITLSPGVGHSAIIPSLEVVRSLPAGDFNITVGVTGTDVTVIKLDVVGVVEEIYNV